MKETVVYRGPSTLALLGVLFVGLKLAGYISWSWWLVLLPFYAIPAVILGFILFLLIIAGAVAVSGS